MTTNRDRVIDAAISLLAESGIRSLTHLRVDERAALPKGSASNVFRTREALLVGVCEHMVSRELPEVVASVSAASIDELVDSLVRFFEFLVGPSRAVTAARLALFVEAGHDPAVRQALSEGRRHFEAQLLPMLTALGAQDPQLAMQLIAVTYEGLLVHVFGGHAEVDARRSIDAMVRAAFRMPETA